jgi:hypothetical protein
VTDGRCKAGGEGGGYGVATVVGFVDVVVVACLYGYLFCHEGDTYVMAAGDGWERPLRAGYHDTPEP